MQAFLVFDGREVRIPPSMGTPRPDQMRGTVSEQLIEVAGRVCYDSMGTGRPSGEYHNNLLNVQRHYSVAEHVHRTIKVSGDVPGPAPWFGIPDTSFSHGRFHNKSEWRVTCNLRHMLEWPDNVTFHTTDLWWGGVEGGLKKSIDAWQKVLGQAGYALCPSVVSNLSYLPGDPEWEFVAPERDSERFITVFLEDSLVWSLEQNRHRGNVSQRSGRFVDQTDRPMRMHPMLRDWLNELGELPPDGTGEDGKIFTSDLDPQEAELRLRVGSAVGSITAQGVAVYTSVVDALQGWLIKKGVDKITARKQARSAGRYYLGQGLSTEGLYTYSVTHWNHIFKMRCSPHADAAIRELAEEVRRMLKAESQYGEFLR